MIHFTCDGCQRPINLEEELRYVVRVEVYAAFDGEESQDSDRDHLQEIEDILEALDELDDQECEEEVFQQVRYDLCGECRKKFLRNPLGRLSASPVGFSNN